MDLRREVEACPILRIWVNALETSSVRTVNGIGEVLGSVPDLRFLEEARRKERPVTTAFFFFRK